MSDRVQVEDAVQARGGQIIGAGSVAAHRGGTWQSAQMTDIIALGRLENPLDVAGVVPFLTVPDVGYITGQCLVVNGGTWFS